MIVERGILLLHCRLFTRKEKISGCYSIAGEELETEASIKGRLTMIQTLPQLSSRRYLRVKQAMSGYIRISKSMWECD